VRDFLTWLFGALAVVLLAIVVRDNGGLSGDMEPLTEVSFIGTRTCVSVENEEMKKASIESGSFCWSMTPEGPGDFGVDSVVVRRSK